MKLWFESLVPLYDIDNGDNIVVGDADGKLSCFVKECYETVRTYYSRSSCRVINVPSGATREWVFPVVLPMTFGAVMTEPHVPTEKIEIMKAGIQDPARPHITFRVGYGPQSRIWVVRANYA